MSESAPSRGRLLGYFQAIAAASLWGSSGIFAVNLFRMGVPPESVALLRPVVGVVVLLLFYAARSPKTVRIDGRGFLIVGLGGGALIGLFQIAYQLSTDAVGVPTTVALLYLAPPFVVATSGPLLGEWPTRTRVLLALVTLAGIWLSVLGAEEVVAEFGTTGLIWGVLAGLGYGGYTLFGRYAVPVYGTSTTVLYSTVGSCLLLAAVLPALSGPPVLPATSEAWALLAVFGIVTIALAHTLFFDALARIEASRVSIAASIEPVVAALLATLLVSQGLSAVGWLGIGLVVAGVVGVGLTDRDPAAPTHE